MQASRALLLLVVSLVLVVIGGLALYAVRAPVAGWLAPTPEVAVVEDEPDEVPTAAAEPAPPPPLTRDEIAVRLEDLPERTLALAQEGLVELPDFADLGTEDPVRAKVMANRWQSWTRVWKNRVRVLVAELPPLDQCRRQFDFRPTCDALERSLALLASVPSATEIGDAMSRVDAAILVLERLLTPPEEVETDEEAIPEEPDAPVGATPVGATPADPSAGEATTADSEDG